MSYFTRINMNRASRMFLTGCAIVLSVASAAIAQNEQATATPSDLRQREFATPKEAADALVQAADSFDREALKKTLGIDSEDIVTSEDAVQDKNRAAKFATK